VHIESILFLDGLQPVDFLLNTRYLEKGFCHGRMEYFFSLILAILFTSCMQQTKFGYTDGNGNRYIITSGVLQYIPLTPEESSSGTYSGGEPKVITLHEVQVQAIRKLLEDAIDDQSIHIDKRIMGSAVIEKNSATWIISPQAPQKSRIESLLEEFLISQI